MLINLTRLGMMEEARKLFGSLNGYLNIYRNHMMTSLRAIDYYNNIKEEKIVTSKVVKQMFKIINWSSG